MAIDRGDWHYDDAGSWEAACAHIGTFLLWAVERGLGGDDHEPEALRADPTRYVIGHCDTKLWNDDLSDEGVAFAESSYSLYLEELQRYANARSVNAYKLEHGPEDREHFFGFLDELLASWRG